MQTRMLPGRRYAAAMLVLITGLSLYGEETDFFDIEKPAAARDTVTLQFKSAFFGYVGSCPYSESDDLKEVWLSADYVREVGDLAFVAKVEAGARYASKSQRDEISVRELYAEWHPSIDDRGWGGVLSDDVILRVGQQIFSWGSGILYNPTDNLTSQDTVDPFESRRLGVPAASVSFVTGLQSLDFIYLATFRPTELPNVDERFFIHSPSRMPNPTGTGPTELDVNYVESTDRLAPPDDLRSGQFAVRYTQSVENWDFGLSYFHGYENTAVQSAEIVRIHPETGTADLRVLNVYPEEQVVGVDVSGYIGKWGLHMEAAHFNMEPEEADVGVGDEDYLTILAGVERPLEDVIGTQDFHLTAEYVREFKDGEEDRIFINRVYKDSVLFRLTYTPNYKASAEVRAFYNFDTKASYARAFMDYRFTDHVTGSAGIDVFDGPEDTFFGEYDDRNERGFLKLVVGI